MKSKIIIAMFTLLLFASFTLTSAEEKRVRYITGYISNVDDNLITLTNNLAFRADEHVTAISMTPAVFILGVDRPEGFVYIKNRKVNVTLMKRAGGQFMVPATQQDLDVFNTGRLSEIKSVLEDGSAIELANDEKWILSDKDDKEMIGDWKEGDSVVIYNSANSETDRIINARTTDQASVMKTHQKKIAK